VTAQNPFLRISLILGLILLATMGQQARADLFLLNSSNDLNVPGAPPYASVDVSSPAAGEIQFVVTAIPNSADLVGQFSFNYFSSTPSLAGVSYTGTQTGQSTPFITGTVSSQGNVDNAGSYNYVVGSTSDGNRFHSITYLLTGLTDTTLAHYEVANSVGSLFAVHYYPNGQPAGTGFAYGGTTSTVPEPSTMALAALGGLGFLGYGLRRRLKK